MPGYTAEDLSKHITDELNSLNDLGVSVPPRALTMAADLNIVKDYLDSDLGISELADLFCDLGAL